MRQDVPLASIFRMSLEKIHGKGLKCGGPRQMHIRKNPADFFECAQRGGHGKRCVFKRVDVLVFA